MRLQEFFQLGLLPERLERIGLIAQALGCKALVFQRDLVAGGQHCSMVLADQCIEDRLERCLALHQFVQTLLQAGAVEGFGQIGIRFALQCAHDHCLAAFGGAHDEDAVRADQLQMVQLFEYLLAVLAGPQIVVVQNYIIFGVAA